jgi:haloacetate dehalogenase
VFEGFERRRVVTGEVEIEIRIGGSGPPLLLLHGFPQTLVMWHRIAPRLAERFTVVASDLRGYGDSGKPPGGGDHAAYSKRTMARDQVEVMTVLGFERFALAGHDRGARVAHRMALDHPERLSRLALLDICPTQWMYDHTDKAFASGYYHWFFLIQAYDLPERMIGQDPDGYLESCLHGWTRTGDVFTPEALAEYKRCFRDPAAIHAACEDYRAAAGIDYELDLADLGRRIDCPLLVLWGAMGLVGRSYDVLEVWRRYAREVVGRALPCGHFLPEEAPEETLEELLAFF